MHVKTATWINDVVTKLTSKYLHRLSKPKLIGKDIINPMLTSFIASFNDSLSILIIFPRSFHFIVCQVIPSILTRYVMILYSFA